MVCIRYSDNMKIKSGFTIVELLIVIVVIAILAAISVVAYNGIQDRSKTAQANSDLNSLYKAILAARINAGRNLINVTGSNCTDCYDQARYELTLDNISNGAGIDVRGLKKGDPWGRKYFIDENEGENGSCANKDAIRVANRPDMPVIYIPFYTCPN